ncbi:predicted xylose isomerase [Vibrio astriarenae]|nr:predicted xylose isomerase [Vibrio sp. C7]
MPCYVNARLAERGIPVACEVDIYGALSEYMITCATNHPATLLDINNTVPKDMVEANQEIMGDYTEKDLFMGFHCGNTASSCMKNSQLRFQKIMHSLLEPTEEPNITRGTLEGQIKQETLLYSVCNQRLTPSFVLTLHKATFLTLTLSHSVQSQYLRFLRCNVSTATFLSKNATLTMRVLPLVTWAKLCIKY